MTDELRYFLDANTRRRSRHARCRRQAAAVARLLRPDDDRLLISTLTDRLKARDVRRSGWASLCVMGHEPPYPPATFSGPAEILTDNIGMASAAIAQRMTRAAEPPEPMKDEALTQLGRVLLAVTIERVTAQSYLPATRSRAMRD